MSHFSNFQDQAALAIAVDAVKRNMAFEDQLMLRPRDIEYKYIMAMRAALVEADCERRSKSILPTSKCVPVYREQHGSVRRSSFTPISDCVSHSAMYMQAAVPAMFQLVPKYVQPTTSKATLCLEKARKGLKARKPRAVLAPTPFYTNSNIDGPVPAPSACDVLYCSTDSIPSTYTTTTSDSSSTDSGLSSFDSLDSIYSMYSSDEDDEDLEPTFISKPIPTIAGAIAGRSIIINREYAVYIKKGGLDGDRQTHEMYDPAMLHPRWVSRNRSGQRF